MKTLNTGVYRCKIKEWIKLYTKRLEQYKAKYGEKSFKYRHHRSLINHKIDKWQKMLNATEKQPQKSMLAKQVLLKTEKLFDINIRGKLYSTRSNIEDVYPHYFICKYLVDNTLAISSSNPLGISLATLYNRRNTITKWINESDSNLQKYREYRKAISAHLSENKKVGIGYNKATARNNATLLQK